MDFFSIFIIFIELIFLDIILSVDNAILIATSTKNLEGKDKKIVEIIGASGAVFLRLIFIIIVMITFSLLMSLPFIYIVGGMILVVLGITITSKKEEGKEKAVSRESGILKAIAIIMAGDIMLSFDNAFIIADITLNMGIGFWAEIIVVAMALVVSLVVIIFFAGILGKWMEKYSWIIYIAGWLLISVGIDMMFQDYLWLWISTGTTPFNGSDIVINNTDHNKWLTFLYSYSLGGIIVIFKWWFFDNKKSK